MQSLGYGIMDCSGLIELDTLILDYDAMNWSVYERETHLQAIPAFV